MRTQALETRGTLGYSKLFKQVGRIRNGGGSCLFSKYNKVDPIVNAMHPNAVVICSQSPLQRMGRCFNCSTKKLINGLIEGKNYDHYEKPLSLHDIAWNLELFSKDVFPLTPFSKPLLSCSFLRVVRQSGQE